MDAGGWLPMGEHTVVNESDVAEPVLTAEQWGRCVDDSGCGDP